MSNIWSDLIWVQTVCKGYQQRMIYVTDRLRVKICFSFQHLSVITFLAFMLFAAGILGFVFVGEVSPKYNFQQLSY